MSWNVFQERGSQRAQLAGILVPVRPAGSRVCPHGCPKALFTPPDCWLGSAILVRKDTSRVEAYIHIMFIYVPINAFNTFLGINDVKVLFTNYITSILDDSRLNKLPELYNLLEGKDFARVSD